LKDKINNLTDNYDKLGDETIESYEIKDELADIYEMFNDNYNFKKLKVEPKDFIKNTIKIKYKVTCDEKIFLNCKTIDDINYGLITIDIKNIFNNGIQMLKFYKIDSPSMVKIQKTMLKENNEKQYSLLKIIGEIIYEKYCCLYTHGMFIIGSQEYYNITSNISETIIKTINYNFNKYILKDSSGTPSEKKYKTTIKNTFVECEKYEIDNKIYGESECYCFYDIENDEDEDDHDDHDDHDGQGTYINESSIVCSLYHKYPMIYDSCTEYIDIDIDDLKYRCDICTKHHRDKSNTYYFMVKYIEDKINEFGKLDYELIIDNLFKEKFERFENAKIKTKKIIGKLTIELHDKYIKKTKKYLSNELLYNFMNKNMDGEIYTNKIYELYKLLVLYPLFKSIDIELEDIDCIECDEFKAIRQNYKTKIELTKQHYSKIELL
jgi:hypothetical protein